MTGISCVGANSARPEAFIIEDEVQVRATVARYFQEIGLEGWTLDLATHGPARHRWTDPRHLKMALADARVSVALAIQRHLSNERYRQCLINEPGYASLKPYLSEQFRHLMVRASHAVGQSG